MTQITETILPTGGWIVHTASEVARNATSGANQSTGPLPTQAGSWRLEGLLGEGTFTRVFLARPSRGAANRPAAYALKMLRPQYQDRPELVALLRREATVGRAVVHPHLVAILATQVLEAPYFVVMPRLAGNSLASRLTGQQMLSVPQALWIARQTAEALGALHRRGFLHGDVKPSNLFVAPTGHMTLIDLSFARSFDEPGSVADRPVLGTVNYLAPEQVVSAMRSDQRSDIYSLGVMLYEMLTGQLPLVASDLTELVRLQREQRPRQLRALRPDAPQSLANLVRQMLTKEPMRRPESIEEVIRRLVALEIETLPESVPV
jgi:serine/threonine protein kinase